MYGKVQATQYDFNISKQGIKLVEEDVPSLVRLDNLATAIYGLVGACKPVPDLVTHDSNSGYWSLRYQAMGADDRIYVVEAWGIERD